MRKRKRRVRDYTEIGKRIVALSGGRQRGLAGALGLSQQSVSKKLRGEVSILLTDLEKLSRHYKVPLTYFFEDPGSGGLPPELAVACERAKAPESPFRELVVTLSRLPDGSLERVAEAVRAMAGALS